MKIKTSELIGPALDWAVAKCESRGLGAYSDDMLALRIRQGVRSPGYSTDWSQGGPIIERERICIYYEERLAPVNTWRGYLNFIHDSVGPTPLIAAMRCYCCSKLGDEIDIPEELLQCQQQNS